MATTKNVKRIASAILGDWKPGHGKTVVGTVEQLAKQIEELAELTRTEARERSIRATPDGMYIRHNTGSYVSKIEGQRAMKTIERLSKPRK